MSTEADWHEIVVTDADWTEAEARAYKGPGDDPAMRPEHSKHGERERDEVAKIALRRWGTDRGFETPGDIEAKEAPLEPWDHKPRNLLVPPHRLVENPSGRFCLLLSPPNLRNVAGGTIWFFAGWINSEEVEAMTLLEKPKLPATAWLVPRAKLKTPALLEAELRR